MNEHGLDDARAVGGEREDLVDDMTTLLIGRVHDTLLDDVGGELLLSEDEDLTVDLADDHRLVGRVSLLDDPLDHVLCRTSWSARSGRRGGATTHVAVLILKKTLSVTVKLVEQHPRLSGRAVLEDALEHTASIRMSSKSVNLTDASVGDEGDLVAGNSLESALRE